MSADILIIEVEKVLRESLQDLLELEGYKVDAVPSGEDALEKLNEEAYALMLLELELPGTDGVEVMSQAHLLHPETRVIILTGHGSLETAIKGVRLGVQDYILKPFEAGSLLASVEHCFTAKFERQREEMLLHQLESSIEQLKDLLGITKPELPGRRIISLPQGIMVDLERREIWRGNTQSHLTPTEGRVLGIFLDNQGRVMTHEELVLLEKGIEVTGEEAPEILRPMISRLRKKLAAFPGVEKWVKSVRGIGYVFEVEG